MKIHYSMMLSAACLAAMLSNNLNAADTKPADHDEHEHEMEQHGSHEHGAARMTVAVTDSGLEIALETPAANIFGFEHTAGSDEEHHVVHEAADKLKAGDKLFSFDEKAGCQLDDVAIESNIIAAHDKERHADGEQHADDHEKGEHNHDKHDENEKEEHDHDKYEDHEKEAHDHDKHDEDKEDKEAHDHDHEGEGTHSDVGATWTFKCEQPAQLTQMETGIFAAFPNGFERLNVEWINEDAAGAVALEADGTVKFSQ